MNKVRCKPTNSKNSAYVEAALEQLKLEPSKLSLLESNCQQFKNEYSFNKGLLTAIERLEWILCIDDDIERITHRVLSDDYISRKIVKYPLLFKGIT
ncbi:hypothetical protein NI389_20470 (plasmid) [Pseudoalteromonas xiamenensis]|uniref:hypothetical protein n=1 Tax=Pseudoalteromonas xiamenensis TaxID=882626 RepID=UPI0027E40763|nr:hypothetical protein [Pseudoalteromonas xiamenensis]WMN62171.1 hypothetical protein NI389_20470 [Pseudoalteromonas xiamenensis]